jgi:hypothetical protein
MAKVTKAAMGGKITRRYLSGAPASGRTAAQSKAGEPEQKRLAKKFKNPRDTKKGNVYTGGGF